MIGSLADSGESPQSPGVVAFYLPQFHPTVENDEWWGPGFTEWRNVARARPRFIGHYQPHEPADLGYYDLRLHETRLAQEALARQYGVLGFCYYHYWFEGRRLLNEPLDRKLAHSDESLPFMLCWANETWSRRWDGSDADVLIEQRYSPEDDEAHINWLIERVLHDERYICVDGKPVLLIYRPSSLPDSRRTLDLWRERTTSAGLAEPIILGVRNFGSDRIPFASMGLDGAVDFQPNFGCAFSNDVDRSVIRRLGSRGKGPGRDRVASYGSYVRSQIARSSESEGVMSCVFPSWDNTARRRVGATMFASARPELFQAWVREEADRARRRGLPFVFVNAWNEWAEGCHLEPCQQIGHGYLVALQRGMATERPDREATIPVLELLGEASPSLGTDCAVGRMVALLSRLWRSRARAAGRTRSRTHAMRRRLPAPVRRLARRIAMAPLRPKERFDPIPPKDGSSHDG